MWSSYVLKLNGGKNELVLINDEGKVTLELGLTNPDGSGQFSVEAPLTDQDVRILGDLLTSMHWALEDLKRELKKEGK